MKQSQNAVNDKVNQMKVTQNCVVLLYADAATFIYLPNLSFPVFQSTTHNGGDLNTSTLI
jgi:ABC-type uncharacterized transport system permease subunit